MRAVNILIIFLVLFTAFSAVANADTGQTKTYKLVLHDERGMVLSGEFVEKHMLTKIYVPRRVLDIQIGWSHLFDKAGGNFTFSTNAEKIMIKVYWYGKERYANVIYLTNEKIDITLNFIPAKPIVAPRSEGVSISSDMHEISSSYYTIRFGIGDDKNEIMITLNHRTFIIPVYLNMAGAGSNDKKPFRFLSQGNVVEGEDKFLIWQTGKYISVVNITKIGDNSFAFAWTYIYADIAGEWVKRVITAAAIGAVIGSYGGPGVGTIVVGAGGGLAAAIAWAIKPDLVNLSANAAIGVIAGYITPRFFIIQGTSGLGHNITGNTEMNMGDVPAGVLVNEDKKYEILKESNTLRVGYTKFYGLGRKEFSGGFEDELFDGWTQWGSQGSLVIENNIVHSGYHSLKISKGATAEYKIFIKDKGKYAFTVDLWKYSASWGEHAYSIAIHNASYSGEIVNSKGQQTWVHYTKIYEFEAYGNTTITIYVPTYGTGYNSYIDDFDFILQNKSTDRIIFQQSASESVISKFAFDCIPEISPQKYIPTPLGRRYALLAVNVIHDGFLALTWDSPQVVVYYSRIFIKTETQQQTAWLLGTDDRNGFQNATFIIADAKDFVYHIDYADYYIFSTPSNWTITPGWSPWVVNGTVVYTIPQDWNGFSLDKTVRYTIASWWNNIGVVGHLAIIGLTALIILIILAVIAPSIIIQIFKVIGAMIRAIIKGIGALGKAIGKGLKAGGRRT